MPDITIRVADGADLAAVAKVVTDAIDNYQRSQGDQHAVEAILGPEQLVRVTEAVRVSEGDLTYRDAEDLLRSALTEAFGGDGVWIWVRDLTDEWVAYERESDSGLDTYKVGYSIDEATNAVTFTGEPEQVLLQTSYEPIGGQASVAHVREARVTLEGRVLETKGTDADGCRIFACQIIEAGDSKNGRRYPESVLHAAASLYEGARAFDHHRTDVELKAGSTVGLIGAWRNVEAVPGGLAGDLHLLPSASAAAEALDASVAAAAQGLPPLVGISHDVQITERPVLDGGARVMECTAIKAVLSADVVSEPAAGGRATRVVAGGIDPSNPSNTPTPKEGNAMTLKELLDQLRAATEDKRAELLQEHGQVLTLAGFSESDVPTLLGIDPAPEGGTETEPESEGAEPEPVGAAETYDPRGHLGSMLVDRAIESAGLDPARFGELVRRDLGARFTEAQLTTSIERTKRAVEALERDGLTPGVGHVRVVEEDLDKKVARLDATFDRRWSEGYTGIAEMYVDIMGLPSSQLYGTARDDLAARIVRECWEGPMVGRAQESLDSTSFGQILADALNRRMVKAYTGESLATWRMIAETAPVRDFRSQKLVRMGGFGTLPTVNEGAPYQPLTSPGDEEATYTPTKKGGTEDYTYEMAKNDDIRSLVAIPTKLARAAAITLYRAVWDLLATNPTIYDGTSLFTAGHANTATSLTLSQTNLSTARRKMREQAAYGDSVDVLGLTPKTLAVPPELEELAFQLCTSAVAIPGTPAGPSDTPNIHQGLTPVVVDYWTEADDWFLIADPADIPTIEVGFLDGKEQPELFVQDDPKVGAAFSADKVTWKIRHIYGLAVIDYRGFQRGQTS